MLVLNYGYLLVFLLDCGLLPMQRYGLTDGTKNILIVGSRAHRIPMVDFLFRWLSRVPTMNIVSFISDDSRVSEMIDNMGCAWGILIEKNDDGSGKIEMDGFTVDAHTIMMPYPMPSDNLKIPYVLDSWTDRMDKILYERRFFLQHFGGCRFEIDNRIRVSVRQMYNDLLDMGDRIENHGFFMNTFWSTMEDIADHWTRSKGYSSIYKRVKEYNELEGFDPKIIARLSRKVARHYKASKVELLSVNRVDIYSSERKWFRRDMTIATEYTHSITFSYKVEPGIDKYSPDGGTWITTWGITTDGKYSCWAD